MKAHSIALLRITEFRSSTIGNSSNRKSCQGRWILFHFATNGWRKMGILKSLYFFILLLFAFFQRLVWNLWWKFDLSLWEISEELLSSSHNTNWFIRQKAGFENYMKKIEKKDWRIAFDRNIECFQVVASLPTTAKFIFALPSLAGKGRSRLYIRKLLELF